MSQKSSKRSSLSKNVLSCWLQNHFEVLISSLLRMRESLIGHLLTAAVIGLALSLPAGLYLGIDSLRAVSGDLQVSTRISVFLTEQASDDDASALAQRLRPNPDIQDIQVITRAQALDEFRQTDGFREVVDALESNPLPPVLLIEPAADASTDIVSLLVDDLRALPETTDVILDMLWLQRLQAMVEGGERLIWALSIILGLGLVLVVGNTIRLHIRNRQDEIEIVMMIGGTDAFIRRPFLYTGLWYGLIGGILAWLIVELTLMFLIEPAQLLGELYQQALPLHGMGIDGLMTLIGAGIAVGLGGAWLVVTLYLRRAEPA